MDSVTTWLLPYHLTRVISRSFPLTLDSIIPTNFFPNFPISPHSPEGRHKRQFEHRNRRTTHLSICRANPLQRYLISIACFNLGGGSTIVTLYCNANIHCLFPPRGINRSNIAQQDERRGQVMLCRSSCNTLQHSSTCRAPHSIGIQYVLLQFACFNPIAVTLHHVYKGERVKCSCAC
jgi:hypothetical protein